MSHRRASRRLSLKNFATRIRRFMSRVIRAERARARPCGGDQRASRPERPDVFLRIDANALRPPAPPGARLGAQPPICRFETFASGSGYAAEAFTVKIPRAGLELRVGENETMLTALARAGIDIMSDCQRGECGLCAVDVLGCEGTMDHRDVFFSDHEHGRNEKICACVSRASSSAQHAASASTRRIPPRRFAPRRLNQEAGTVGDSFRERPLPLLACLRLSIA